VHAHPQHGAIHQVKGNGGLTTDFVTDLNGAALDFDAQFFYLGFKHLVKDVSFGNLAEFGVSVVVIGKVNARFLDFLIAEFVKNTLGDNGCSVFEPHNLAFDDGRNHQVDNLVHSDGGLVEHLRDDNHGVVASSPDAEGKMSGRTSHSSYHKPVFAGAGILVHRGPNACAFGFGRLVPKSG